MPNYDERLPDRIYETFCDKTIFITGGTGFIGRTIIERLLRTFEIKIVYILIRPKKGKDAQTRLGEIFSTVLFDKLRALKGDAIFEKCQPICGDVSATGLGLSLEDRLTLQNEVEFVIHTAATVKFNEPLKCAIATNTKGTYSMLQLAKEMKRLKLFVNVSTCYCHPERKVLYEKFYPSKYKAQEVIQTLDWLDDKSAVTMTSALLDNIPNTYTFSKALAEDLVADFVNEIPVINLRPSIVIPIWKEPIPGWTNNLNGPIGLMTAAGKGVVRSMPGNRDIYADFISVDAVADGTFAIITYCLFNGIPERIFNMSTGTEVEITWGEVVDIGKDISKKQVPFDTFLWVPGGNLRKNRFHHQVATLLTHLLPAIIVDALVLCFGYKPFLWKIQKRIRDGMETMQYYTLNQWTFKNKNVKKVQVWLNDRELSTYTTTAKDVDIPEYFKRCAIFARKYILKEPDENLPRAKRVMKIMVWVDRICNVLLKLLLAFLFYKFIFLRIYV